MSPAEWEAKLAELAGLEDGWYDGTDGEAIDSEVLGLARELVADITADGGSAPFICPMLEAGGVSMVWRTCGSSVTLRIYSMVEFEVTRMNPGTTVEDRRDSYQFLETGSLAEMQTTLASWLK